MAEIEGETLDDLIHRIGNVLVDQELERKLGYVPLLFLVQQIDTTRFFTMTRNAVNAMITVKPAEGKVWTVEEGFLTYVADAQVADRNVKLRVYSSKASGYPGLYFEKTVAASESVYWCIGHETPSGDAPASAVFNASKPILTDDCELRFEATLNGQSGDTLSLVLLVKEVVNYVP